ncbi:M23 family metallopeptidase [Massilia sp. PAMC28688]|uniref:M23 family metallopeptidase n=1 Tax=Massilia sp. PAMC28688 TaxID=2861283 RepID=UPI001C636E8F|nr:M23 family metallopeptidase [Massilia sp. PAMC28688]QYF95220.1 M23 family metallopeptidase [Massilia sp. PAMC28688]
MKSTTSSIAVSFLCASTALFSGAATADVFPLKSDDLGLTHRYKTSDHATGANQGLGKDIIAMRPVGNDKWSHLVADGADKTVNANHLIYGRKVYAMVSGTVVNCWRNAPDNARAGTKDPDVVSHLIGVGGNHMVIKTADGVFVKHSHLVPGTMPSALCPHNKTRFDKPSGSTLPPEAAVVNGAKITKGQFLGLAGNSGNSSMPHLHVHMFKDNAPYQMKFEHGQTTPFTDGTASLNGPWTLLNGSALPTGPILIWAPRSTGYWTVNDIPAARFQGWFNHMKDSGQMPESLACTAGGAIYNTQWVPSKGAWYARAGMNATEMANLTNTLAAQGFYQYKWWYCDAVRSAIWRK